MTLPTPSLAPAEVTLPLAQDVRTRLVEKGLPGDHIAAVCDLLDYAHTRALPSVSRVAAHVDLSLSTLSRLLSGEYGAKTDSVTRTIRNFLDTEQHRAAYGERIYLPKLSVVKDVHAVCRMTFDSGAMGRLWGRNQSGKSCALRTFAPSDFRVVYVSMPSGGGTRLFIEYLARALGIKTSKGYHELREMIIQRFTPQMLLIVDEFHQALPPVSRTFKMPTLEFIRLHVFEERGTPVLLCGTDVMAEAFSDTKYSGLLGQIDNRCSVRRRIPPHPLARDVRHLCRAYGFADLEEPVFTVASRIAKEHGIGRLVQVLRKARSLAQSGRKLPEHPITLTHGTELAWANGVQLQKEEEE